MNQSNRRVIVAIVVILILSAFAWPAGAGSRTRQSSSQPHTLIGSYATTNPLFPTIGADTGVLLYDLAGKILEDYAFVSPENAQVLGELDGDITSGSYTIELPDVPQGTPLDFDGDPTTPAAVQVFVPAIYINFLGDQYINRGESPLDTSVVVEPLTYDMIGGQVVVWAERDGESFPGALGADGAIFSDDDPLITLPAGWSVVSMDTDPFTIVRDETVTIPIVESSGGLNDYTDLDYEQAWERLFERTRITYPFTEDKHIDWNAIHDTITPLVQRASNDLEFHLVIARFGSLIPDSHIGYISVPVVQNFLMGGIGISHIEVTDSDEVVVMAVGDGTPAADAGIEVGSVLLTVDGEPAIHALETTPLLFRSASTPQSRLAIQASIMLQGQIGSTVSLEWRTPESDKPQSVELTRVADITSLLGALNNREPGEGVITARMLDSGLGYIIVRGFAEDVSAADALFASDLQDLIDAGATGVIIDIRDNTGGLVSLAMSMAGHFFTDYDRLFNFLYADGEGDFAYRDFAELLPSQPYYDGPVAVLVNEITGSAGDMFAYAMIHNDRALIVGHTATAGFTGEISDGQYKLPGDLTMQIPTGRPVDPVTGATLIEGTGVEPDIRVPLTLESLLSPEDEVLSAAEAALLAQ